MNARKLLVLVLVVLAAALAGCAGGEGELVIDDAWVRPSPLAQGNGAAYMAIRNNTQADDALIGAASGAADAVEIHESMEMDGDMMSMQPVERIDLPAGGVATLEPGGYHVMLIGLHDQLREGDSITLTLSFEVHDDLTIEVPVREE